MQIVPAAPSLTRVGRWIARAVLLYGSLTTARAQAPRGTVASNRTWQVFDTRPATLTIPTVRGITQSRDGFLWLATDGALVRYDGVRYLIRHAPAGLLTDSLPEDYFRDVVEARDGRLWLAGWHRGVIVRDGPKFTTYRVLPAPTDDQINDLFEDSRGVMWAATQNGLARFDTDHFEGVPGLAGQVVYTIGEDVDGTIWVGTEHGLYLIVRGRAVLTTIATLRDPRIPAIRRGRDGVMWVGTAQGLMRVERRPAGDYVVTRTYGTRDGARSAYISSLTEQQDGTIWVGTLGGGVMRVERTGQLVVYDTRDGLADNSVLTIYADRSGNVWVGTADGFSRLTTTSLAMWSGAGSWTSSTIWSVRPDPNGEVWVGTGADGVVRIRPDGSTRVFTQADGLPSDVGLTSHRRPDGSVWVGTRRGVARLVGDRFVDETARLGLPTVGVRTLFDGIDGRFWIGTDTALTVSGPDGKQHFLRHGAGTLTGRVYGLQYDGRGRLLVAGGKLAYVSGDSLALYRSVTGDTVEASTDVSPDIGGLTWIASGPLGLTLLRGDSIFRFLPSKTGVLEEVLQITDDGRGSLWLDGGKGAQRVDKQDLIAWLADSTHHIRKRMFTKVDGLRSNDFSKSGNASGGVGPDGRLWLPSTAGIVIIDPAIIPVDATAPHVTIDRLLADNDTLAVSERAVLPRGVRDLRIEFSAPSLGTANRLTLWYQLEGVDDGWRRADPLERAAQYHRIPRGTLAFRVRAENADGAASTSDATITIVSRPALTESWIFWTVLVALIAVLVYSVYRVRMGAERERSAALQRQVDERTEALATRARLEHQLLHAQKLESVGRLAGGVAHDLNNLLTAVLGHAELALSEEDVPGAVRSDLEEVRTASSRAANLTRQLLTFARKQVSEPRNVRVGDVIGGLDKLLRGLMGEEVALLVDAADGEWLVRIDPNQLEQVIMNLAANARDAMGGRGTLRLTSRATTLREEFTAIHPELAPGDYVVLEVMDTGTGMSPEVRAHLFEPFFTTKEPGKGTGLGLATSFGIVTQSGGQILVESAEGAGTTFSLYFPRAAGSATTEQSVPAAMPRGTERVLLVEDESAVRDVAERTLRALGYVVTTASDGQQALDVLEATPGAIDVVVTDLRMPRLGGFEAARRARERWPSLRVVFMSGHAEPLLDEVQRSGIRLVRKPFTASQLAVAVRQTLDAAPGRG